MLPMTLITETSKLIDACERFSRDSFLAIDTEFMRERTYYPQLCLIQIAGKDEAVTVDALATEISLDTILDLMVRGDARLKLKLKLNGLGSPQS